MKTLYLKNGLCFENVEILEIKPTFGKISRVIKLPEAIIDNAGFNNCNVQFTELKMPFFVVSGVSEIIENFDFYFNNLNQ